MTSKWVCNSRFKWQKPRNKMNISMSFLGTMEETVPELIISSYGSISGFKCTCPIGHTSRHNNEIK
jgi:hypothetical protein